MTDHLHIIVSNRIREDIGEGSGDNQVAPNHLLPQPLTTLKIVGHETLHGVPYNGPWPLYGAAARWFV